MKPYVYIIQNLEKTHWYVGMRSANKCPAIEDTGYWGSSKYLKKLIKKTGKDQWKKTIVAEFDTVAEASEHETELLELMWDWDGRVNKSRGGYIDFSDPEVRAKNKAANEAKAQDPEWIAKMKAINQEKTQNPEWIAKNKVAMQKLAQDPEWRAKNKVANQKKAKPFIATNIATGEEFYCESSRCEQAKALKLHPSNVSNCLNGKYSCSNYKGFTFRYV